jgi:hypothetical protein
MWDNTERSATGRLSHDLPCAACGHPTHRFLACSESCACVPPPLPGLPEPRPERRAPQASLHLTA